MADSIGFFNASNPGATPLREDRANPSKQPAVLTPQFDPTSPSPPMPQSVQVISQPNHDAATVVSHRILNTAETNLKTAQANHASAIAQAEADWARAERDHRSICSGACSLEARIESEQSLQVAFEIYCERRMDADFVLEMEMSKHQPSAIKEQPAAIAEPTSAPPPAQATQEAKKPGKYVSPHLRRGKIEHPEGASAHFGATAESDVIDPMSFTQRAAPSVIEAKDKEVMAKFRYWRGETPPHYHNPRRPFNQKEAAFHFLPGAIAADLPSLSRMPYTTSSSRPGNRGGLEYHYDLPCYARFQGKEETGALGLIADDRGKVFHFSISDRKSYRLEDVLRGGRRPNHELINRLSLAQPRLEDESFVYYLTERGLILIIPKGTLIQSPNQR